MRTDNRPYTDDRRRGRSSVRRIHRFRRRGFYFSFDALMALTLMGIATIFLLSTSDPVRHSLDTTGAAYQKTNNRAEDATQIAIRSRLKNAFPDPFVQSYIDDTALDPEDKKKSVLNVIAILWASNETSTARNITRELFGDILGGEFGYRLSILSDGTRNVIYNTSFVPADAEFIANAKRIVSGVARNRPQQGYLARARATTVEKNDTRVLTFSPMGGANSGGKLNIWKRFNVSDTTDVVNATLYIAVHYGCDNSQFENLKLNGNNIKKDIKWVHQEEDCGSFASGTGAYGVVHNPEEHLVNGTNTVYMRLRNNEYNAHTHPGMKLELELVDQESDGIESPVRKRVEFDEVLTTEQGNDDSGAFAVKPFAIPQDATVKNVTIRLEATDVEQVVEGVDANCGAGGTTVGDVMVYFNGEQIYRDEAPADEHVVLSMNVTNWTEKGTNVVAAYFNTFGDCFWGDGETHIIANRSSQNSSYINVTYTLPDDSLVFGKIELTRNEQLGGGLENPKTYEKNFSGHDVRGSFLHVAQLFSNQVTVNVTDANGVERKVFESEGVRSVPSSIFIDPSYYRETGNNTIYMEDETAGNEFLPESSLEYTLLIPSQVPYGDTFQNRSAAQRDARERLNETLGAFVDATEIVSSALSVSNLPWLFGPVTVELKVWRE